MTVRLQAACILSTFAVLGHAGWVTDTIPVDSFPGCVAINPVTGRAYVSSQHGSSVVVIEGTEGNTAQVSVGKNPGSLSVNPVTDKVYVTRSDTIVAIDGATRTVVFIPVLSPSRSAVDATTNRIYVVSYQDTAVTVIDGATNSTVIARLPAARYNGRLAFNPATSMVYVTSGGIGASWVVELNCVTGDTCRLPVGEAPTGVTANPATNMIFVTGQLGILGVIYGETHCQTSAPATASKYAAVSPGVNRIYVSPSDDHDAVVVDGATLDSTVAPLGEYSLSAALNSVTGKVYMACGEGDDPFVAEIGYPDNDVSLTPVGGLPKPIAVNPVTCKVYVPCAGDNMVVVLDGSSNTETLIPAGSGPVAVAADPVADKVYVAESTGAGVTVIDGPTRTASRVAAPGGISSIAVNPVNGRAYAASRAGRCIVVIDGASLDTTVIASPGGPLCLGVNEVTNRVYVGDTLGLAVIDGATNELSRLTTGSRHDALAVNPVTNRVYALDRAHGALLVLDGASLDTTWVRVGESPQAVAVNRLTGLVYVANSGSDDVTIIDGSGGDTTGVAVGDCPTALAVDEVRNRVYVANESSGTVSVIRGAGPEVATIRTGLRPCALGFNSISNKLYVASSGSDSVAIIDGATQSLTYLPASAARSLAVNPVTGRIYVPCTRSDNLIEIEEIPFVDTRVRVEFEPPLACTTSASQPVVLGKGVNRWTPERTPMLGVITQMNTFQKPWNWSAVLAGAGTDSIMWAWTWGTDSLVWGANLLCCVPLEACAATTNNVGLGTPFVGNPLVKPVYRVQHQYVGTNHRPEPPPADLSLSVAPSPFRSGTQIDYTLPRAGPVSIKLYDRTGRLARSLVRGSVRAGRHSLALPASALPSGVYLLRMDVPGRKSLTRKLVRR